MPTNKFAPTPYPDVNFILHELLIDIQQILQEHLIGMYLEGSLANGDFDRESDIDFVVVVDEEISPDQFSALYAMHEKIAKVDSWWAVELEGSYVPRQALRRHGAESIRHPNIERGSSEKLKWADHDETWNVHRYLLRERGITILGPDSKTLIDPVTAEDLRKAMQPALHGWARNILENPDELVHQGYQTYVVLTLCRILYTLQFGDVVSKPKAAKWAKETYTDQWGVLIDRTWEGRNHPQLDASAEDISQTLEFIKFTVGHSPFDL